MLVNDVLVQQFGDIMDPDFTALLEDKLDEVAQGERPWVPVVQEFYEPLNRDLERANTEVERLKPAEIATDEVCSQGHPMVIKEGRFGRFLACTSYPEHKETRPLPEELPPGAPEEHCSHGVLMQLRTGRYGPFYTSTHECGETKPFAQRVGVLCPDDGGEILEKRSKKGRPFYRCGNWPDCDWARPAPTACSSRSMPTTSKPRGTAVCAIPAPMVPRPTIASVLNSTRTPCLQVLLEHGCPGGLGGPGVLVDVCDQLAAQYLARRRGREFRQEDDVVGGLRTAQPAADELAQDVGVRPSRRA